MLPVPILQSVLNAGKPCSRATGEHKASFPRHGRSDLADERSELRSGKGGFIKAVKREDWRGPTATIQFAECLRD